MPSPPAGPVSTRPHFGDARLPGLLAVGAIDNDGSKAQRASPLDVGDAQLRTDGKSSVELFLIHDDAWEMGDSSQSPQVVFTTE